MRRSRRLVASTHKRISPEDRWIPHDWTRAQSSAAATPVPVSRACSRDTCGVLSVLVPGAEAAWQHGITSLPRHCQSRRTDRSKTNSFPDSRSGHTTKSGHKQRACAELAVGIERNPPKKTYSHVACLADGFSGYEL